MRLLLPPQLSHDAKRQIEQTVLLHGIKNPVVVELEQHQGMRRFEITEGDRRDELSDAKPKKETMGPA